MKERAGKGGVSKDTKYRTGQIKSSNNADTYYSYLTTMGKSPVYTGQQKVNGGTKVTRGSSSDDLNAKVTFRPDAKKAAATKKRATPKKAVAKKETGRSADAAAGAAAAKKATARAKATGQTTQSAMDAVSRRYKPQASLYRDLTGERRILRTVKDKTTGYMLSGKRGVNLYGTTYIEPTAAKKKRRTPKK